jgi:hypothetical protein
VATWVTRPTETVRRSLLALLVAGATGVVAGCGSAGGPTVTYPPPSARPVDATGPAIDQARAALVQALGTRNLVLQDAQVPYRPAEGPALASAPRAVFQVVLPNDLAHGFLVVYALRDVPTAAAAGADQAAYLGTGPGRVQTPLGTQHLIRQLGSTLIVYSWHPGGVVDEREPRIAEVLATIGTEIAVPS